MEGSEGAVGGGVRTGDRPEAGGGRGAPLRLPRLHLREQGVLIHLVLLTISHTEIE